jgi:hypothetical protein
MNRLEHDSESTNLTHHKQKWKHFKSQKTHPQDQNEFKKRKVDFSKNTNNNKKEKSHHNIAKKLQTPTVWLHNQQPQTYQLILGTTVFTKNNPKKVETIMT